VRERERGREGGREGGRKGERERKGGREEVVERVRERERERGERECQLVIPSHQRRSTDRFSLGWLLHYVSRRVLQFSCRCSAPCKYTTPCQTRPIKEQMRPTPPHTSLTSLARDEDSCPVRWSTN
jgi:hypothetical protein